MRKTAFLVMLLLCAFVNAWAQSNRVSGIITDEKNQPVPNVSIMIRGTKSGTTSDVNGKYILTVPLGATLIVSGVGYEEKTAKHNGGNTLSVQIQSASVTMDDVVVTGVAQATSSKKIAFSITRVDQAKINTVPALDLSQTLRGKVAGIQISQTQGDDGASVFLRGAKSMFGNIAPLIVIDGFVTNLALSDLNPQDVEAIEVVKGAAASALYGTRAEGGVIQIVSKKGKNTRRGVEISLDNEYGINNIQRTPKLATMHYYKTNDADPYGFAYAANTATSRIQNFQPNGFSVILSPYKTYYNNTKALLGDNPYFSNYVSLSTSGDKYNAFLSFRNQYTGGVIQPMAPNKKQSVAFRAQFRPTSKLEAEVSFNYFNEVKPSSAATGDGQGTFFAATMQWEPFIDLAAKNAAGNYNVRPDGWNVQGANLTNPLYEWSKRQYTNDADDYLGGAKLRYKILKNLSVEALGSIRKSGYTSSSLYPLGYETTTSSESLNNGNLSLSYSEYQMMNGQAQINYNTTFGEDFTFAATGKMVYESWYNKGFGVSGYDFSGSVPIYVIGNTRADTRSGSGSNQFTDKTVNYGYYLSGQSAWRDKVFLDVLARVDQSSRYGIDEQTAFFPRVALAYRLTQDFNLGAAISDLKVRVNYGAAGSVPWQQ
jgi:outer membrane cobalamin receptor